MADCEVCGNPIRGPAQTVLLEGALMRVCATCARLGKPAPAPAPRRFATAPAPPPRPPPPLLREPDTALVPEYNRMIKQAREKLPLSQEELGRKISEKPSVIHLLETGRLKPDAILARKLEHTLRIQLFVPVEAEE